MVGAGNDMVVVHGLSGSWRWWSPLVETLSERNRLHLVELPRLGRLRAGEMAPWLGRLLDAVGLGRVDVLAHSLGGLVATELAIDAAESGAEPGVGGTGGGSVWPRRAQAHAAAAGGAVRRSRKMQTIVGDAVRTGPVSLVHGIAYVWERDIRGELGAVRAPTLLVWGERDRLVPAWVAEEWQRLLPRSQLVRLPCGHVPMWEAPRELASCVLAFLGDQLPDDSGEQEGLRVGNRVRLAGNDDEAATR